MITNFGPSSLPPNASLWGKANPDPLDKNSKVKWAQGLPLNPTIRYFEGYKHLYGNDRYLYKVLDANSSGLENKLGLMENLRKYTTKIASCVNSSFGSFDEVVSLLKKLNSPMNPRDVLNGLALFVNTHLDLPRPPDFMERVGNSGEFNPFKEIGFSENRRLSRYLISEMPLRTGFDGLNVPRSRRVVEKAPNIGIQKDYNLRAGWKDVFLKLYSNQGDPTSINPRMEKLLLHELSHTAANHIRFRPDDHYDDFKTYESILRYCACKIRGEDESFTDLLTKTSVTSFCEQIKIKA